METIKLTNKQKNVLAAAKNIEKQAVGLSLPKPQRVRRRRNRRGMVPLTVASVRRPTTPLLGPGGIRNRNATPSAIKDLTARMQRDMTIETPSCEGLKLPVRNSLGTTDDGRDFAMAALHPCGEGIDPVGIPDTTMAAIVTPQYKGEFNIVWDQTMFGTPIPSPVGTWSVQIISLPIPELAYAYRIRDDSSNTWSDLRAVRLPGFVINHNNVIIGSATFTANTGTTLQTLGYSKYRMMAKGLTLALDANAVNNQGRLVSAQFSSDQMPNYGPGTILGEPFWPWPTVGSVGDLPNYQQIMAVPNTPEYMVSACPKVYQGLAKDGAYIVHRFDGPMVGMQYKLTGNDSFDTTLYSSDTDPTIPTNGIGWPGTSLALEIDDRPGFQSSYYKWTEDSSFLVQSTNSFTTPDQTTGGQFMIPSVSRAADMTTSVTFITGLAGGTTLANLPSIRVKLRSMIECISGGSPSIAPFTHPAPLLDQMAMDMTAKLGQMGADAYPESYNSFSDILGTLWGGVKQILGDVAPIAGQAALKSLGGLLGAGLGGIF